MLAGDGCGPQAADRGVTQLYYVARAAEAEVIVLRHQLNILRRQSPKRVRPNAFDRAIFVCLYRYFPDTGCPGIAEEPTPASHVLAYSSNAGQQRHSLEGRLLLLAALQDGA
jgi:hypothetical protein